MFDQMKKKMNKILEIVSDELKMIRAGRARPNMIEDVTVEAYDGVYNKLIEVANISAPDPNLLMVKPWDQSVIKKVQKGLAEAELNLNPVIDGDAIRIVIPQLTEERRKEMVKLVNQKMESGKQMLRDARNDMKKEIDEMEGESGVSEDDIHAWLEEMQKLYDDHLEKLESMGEKKEEELMQI